MVDNKTLKSRTDYARAIAEEWIKHATEADQLAESNEPGALYEQGFHAFMANAINSAAQRAAPDVRAAYEDLTHDYEYAKIH